MTVNMKKSIWPCTLALGLCVLLSSCSDSETEQGEEKGGSGAISATNTGEAGQYHTSAANGGKSSSANGGQLSSSSAGGSSASSGGKTGPGGGGGNSGNGANAGTKVEAGSGGDAGGACTRFGTPGTVGNIDSSALEELSGLVASRSQPGVLYAHADSSGDAAFYALSASGASLGTYSLTGITAKDWEDISIGPKDGGGNFVYIGDIGDNSARTGSGSVRSEIQIYRVTEPSVSLDGDAGQVSLSGTEKLRLVYPDKAHDAETLLVDPRTSDILIVTKETDGRSKVFRAPASAWSVQVTVLEEVATLALGSAGQDSALATAGDISPTGDRVILRTYKAILLWPRLGSWTETFSAEPVELPSPNEKQGEGLTFSGDGKRWLSAGEQSAAIYSASSLCP
jgi:hypothetical protein